MSLSISRGGRRYLLISMPSRSNGGPHCWCWRTASRLRLPVGKCRFCARGCRGRHRLHRPIARGDRTDGRQDPRAQFRRRQWLSGRSLRDRGRRSRYISRAGTVHRGAAPGQALRWRRWQGNADCSRSRSAEDAVAQGAQRGQNTSAMAGSISNVMSKSHGISRSRSWAMLSAMWCICLNENVRCSGDFRRSSRKRRHQLSRRRCARGYAKPRRASLAPPDIAMRAQLNSSSEGESFISLR